MELFDQPQNNQCVTIIVFRALRAISKTDWLFGRAAILHELILNAAQGKSTFLWGQKRVGKTSLLQVMLEELRRKSYYSCVLLRMGELRGMHEGQIAHAIASRLCEESGLDKNTVPAEESFGARFGRIIPVIASFMRTQPNMKYVCMIDEFDDLDPAFYTGERGIQFVKALRSVTEEGLTFFFAKSERMSEIHTHHQNELNIWANLRIDHIESIEDCKDLILRPVTGIIEYHPDCVEYIAEYCNKNPFYMHFLCSNILNTCTHECRTYVGETDVHFARDRVLSEIAVGNVGHFWSDNPEIDPTDRLSHESQNCLVLAAAALLPLKGFSQDELQESLGRLDLGPSDQMSAKDFRTTVDRLRARRVFTAASGSLSELKLSLPILHDWLEREGQPILLNEWREFRSQADSPPIEDVSPENVHFVSPSFPISEDELLAVSENLVYLGKQKDVAEIVLWLKQFEDEIRIEIAFLLLKRLAERGFIDVAAHTHALNKAQDMIEVKRKELGFAWQVLRGKKMTLCICHVDDDETSGAQTARDLSKRLRPIKCDSLGQLKRDWLSSFARDGKELIVVVDDFSGTGDTMSKGISECLDRLNFPAAKRIREERRMVCLLLYSLPEALEELKRRYPDIDFNAANVFGDEVRALSPHAGIFGNEDELKCATDMLQQIGAELYPQSPFGHGQSDALICFHDIVPNNSLPIVWSNGTVAGRPRRPLFPRK